MSEEPIKIGPNPCHLCGGEYGEHADHCKVPRMQGREVDVMEYIEKYDTLRREIFVALLGTGHKDLSGLRAEFDAMKRTKSGDGVSAHAGT